MEIKISTLSEADELHSKWSTRTVSLLGVEHQPLYGKNTKLRHFQFFDDIDAQPTGFSQWVIPKKEQIAEVLEYTKDLNDNDRLLVHCFAGISRSTAMLLGILCQHGYTPQDAVDKVYEIRPQMWPNKLIVKFCDELLNLNGTLEKTVQNFKVEHANDGVVQGVGPGITQEDIDAMANIKRILAANSL